MQEKINKYKNNLSGTKINAKITGRQAYAQLNKACLGLIYSIIKFGI